MRFFSKKCLFKLTAGILDGKSEKNLMTSYSIWKAIGSYNPGITAYDIAETQPLFEKTVFNFEF